MAESSIHSEIWTHDLFTKKVLTCELRCLQILLIIYRVCISLLTIWESRPCSLMCVSTVWSWFLHEVVCGGRSNSIDTAWDVKMYFFPYKLIVGWEIRAVFVWVVIKNCDYRTWQNINHNYFFINIYFWFTLRVPVEWRESGRGSELLLNNGQWGWVWERLTLMVYHAP